PPSPPFQLIYNQHFTVVNGWAVPVLCLKPPRGWACPPRACREQTIMAGHLGSPACDWRGPARVVLTHGSPDVGTAASPFGGREHLWVDVDGYTVSVYRSSVIQSFADATTADLW